MVDENYNKTETYDRNTCYFFDIHAVMKADSILVLNNFYTSMGAMGELLIAMNLEKEIFVETMDCKIVKVSVLEMKELILDAMDKSKKI